jgi:Fe-S-cluster containining protein
MNIHPACALCRGACCEFVRLSIGLLAEGHDAARWAGYHGTFDPSMQTVELNCRCSKLTPEGLCAVQDHKPQMCLDAIVGGPSCVHAIGRNRPELRSRLMMLLQTHA